MTNWEKYKDEILKASVIGTGTAVKKNGEIISCELIDCKDCILDKGKGCAQERREWLDAEYKEPEEIDWDNDIDWKKVPVDTPILVRCNKGQEWYKRHFSKKENIYYYAFIDGETSWTIDRLRSWNYCKLARPEDVEKYRKRGK